MGRVVERTRASGTWTEARWTSFVKSALRGASRKWKPKNDCLRKARVSRGIYKCACCGGEFPKHTIENGKKVNNANVDHIKPVIDPATGFTTWDDYIENLFCEEENFQVLCHGCHEIKTNEEKAIAAERRKNEKSKS